MSGKMAEEKNTGNSNIMGERGALLLTLARQAIETYLHDGKRIHYPDEPWLKEKKGVFVTLRKHGMLRGCIGYPEAILPLGEALIRAAISAATQDPRFPPVSIDELPHIKLEVSVLSPLEPVSSIDEVEVGRHGLVVIRGDHRGLLLPDVAVEYGWDRETFLAHTCMKADLEPDAWRLSGTTVLRFTVEKYVEPQE